MKRYISFSNLMFIAFFIATTTIFASGDEEPRLRPRITQDDILSMNHLNIRKNGFRIFCTPFNLADGLGDGPVDPFDTVSSGGRPTLQGNGIFLRINGLDSQTCLECHSILNNERIPAKFGVGGVGGISAAAFPGVIDPDIDASEEPIGNGVANIQGRFINPPFSFGSGGVELLAKEMTADLQALKDFAQDNPDKVVDLVTKGVRFGYISYSAVDEEFDTSGVEGVDEDLVVRPFGRKGNFSTIREFDIGAMQFHHGIQPIEADGVGVDVDADGDGIPNELLVGELSALHIFQISLPPPREKKMGRRARQGQDLFVEIGCANCHRPYLLTETKILPIAFPEEETDPWANVYYEVNLVKSPIHFEKDGAGVIVRLYSDLKRHDMGPALTESTGDSLDPLFITARLWGVASTAPYLHDGRAVTINKAILMHGGEAQSARDIFADLTEDQQGNIITFLKKLVTPRNPNKDLK